MINVASLPIFNKSWINSKEENNYKSIYQISFCPGIDIINKVKNKLSLYGFCVINNLTDIQSNEIIDIFDDNLGNRIRQNNLPNSQEFIVRPRLGERTLVSRNEEQPLHTDMGYTTFVPKTIILQCIKAADSGGYSLIVPAIIIEKYLRNKFNERIELLFEDNAIIYLRGFEGITKSVFSRDATGNIKISFTLFTHMIKGKTDAHEELFREIIEFSHNENNQIRFMLNNNDILVINNQAALHGRTSFSGERILKRIWYEN